VSADPRLPPDDRTGPATDAGGSRRSGPSPAPLASPAAPETSPGWPPGPASERVEAGVLAWSQYTTWARLMEVGAQADAAGYDVLWSWDHLLPIKGDADGPVFEAATTLAGWAAATRRVRLGLMVAANTFRPPALLAKITTTLDHMTGGRMVLGIGAGWFEPEHRAFDLAFGRSPGERLRWLDAAAERIRPLLGRDDEAEGPAGGLPARHLPPPVQPRIPLLIGGAGERRTLAIVARYADAWNLGGTVEEAARKVAVLEAWCAVVGRDPAAIARTLGAGPMVIRDDPRQGRSAVEALAERNRGWDEAIPVLRPAEVVAQLRPYLALGFRSFHIDLPAPYDLETLDRFAGEVRPALAAAVASGRGP
jgi:alkanesulfonate monooxygenase SsuD/methylene tetrahydromethanopterin reductase-like flavin-dependent oxidoreductase (luciferase family)